MTAHLKDIDACPAKRPDKCINCGKVWIAHMGWACLGIGGSFVGTTKSSLQPHQRYLTQDMLASNNIPSDKPTQPSLELELPQAKPLKKDLSDWKVWRNQRAGECACGIQKSMCDYHKGD